MMSDARIRALWKISVEIDVIADFAADFAISQFGPEADDEYIAKSAETQTLIDVYSGNKELIASFIGELHEETRRRIKLKLEAKAKETAK